MDQTSWRYIFWMLASLGTFATVSVLGMMFWMTGRIDQAEHERTRDLLALSLEEKTEKLVHAVEDYAYWTLAYEVVANNDQAAIYEHIGSGATQSALFDQIFILDANGHLLHAYDQNQGAGARQLYHPPAFKTALSALTEYAAKDYVSVSSVIESGGHFFLLSAAWITPDNVASFPDRPYPIMLGTTRLDQAWRSDLARKARARGFVLTRNLSDVSLDAPLLTDARGAPFAALQWEKEYAGSKLRREVMPGLILLCLGLLGICGAAARYFHAQHQSLERANEIAIKDQLTGLLNRAGLAALLRRKAVAKRLVNGQLATIYVDLNKFKELNDTYGHNAGDIALKVTAERLQNAVRNSGDVARLGGDEFICVIADENPEDAATIVAERFIAATRKPISFEEHEQVVDASVGVSIASPGTQWETLLSQSDAAMYWSKKKNAKTPVLFCKSMAPAQPA